MKYLYLNIYWGKSRFFIFKFDYSTGKIYKLTSKLTDKIYISFICNILNNIMSGHT